MSPLVNKKNKLRQEIRKRLKELSIEKIHDESCIIRDNVVSYLTKNFPNSPLNIASFSPLGHEPDLLPLHDLLPNARFFYPLCGDGNTLSFHEIISPESELSPGKMGILEPCKDTPFINPADLDIVLIPGLAFAPDGKRLGKGAGYYDRFLSSPSIKAERIGIALSCQLVDTVPCDSHDLPVHHVISPSSKKT